MGSKNKLSKFSDNERFPNVIQPGRHDILDGNFQLLAQLPDFFNPQKHTVLELGCGKGEYTLELARRFPEKNFIGIDIKGARIWKGAKTALEEGLHNVLFLRAPIELIDLIFSDWKISEIWITFPDPQIKYRRAKHRLTHPAFLNKYYKILEPGATVHLKTDSEFLHGYTQGILHATGQNILYAQHDIYHAGGYPPIVKEVQTFYEKQFLQQGKAITYLAFQLTREI